MKVPFPITFFGVLCILALSAGVTSAATGSTDASPAAALRGPVTIECDGVLPPVAPWGRPAKGRCLITGAIIDAGRFADDHRPLITPHIRTILGSEGTLRISVYREHGNWRIIEGTRAYAGLGGRGWERTQRTGPSGGACPRPQGIACMVSLTMKGTVVP